MSEGTDKPICYDLCCGLGGWTEAFLAEGYRCIGFDIEAHDYGNGGYPGELRLRDILTLHGSELKDATVIVGSSPCQKYSYMAMPWKRAKAMVAYYEDKSHPGRLEELNALFNAQFRIQREASEAAGHYIPLIVENVRGAQKWVGRAQWHYGSFYLWGDVPALMPMTLQVKVQGKNWNEWKDWDGTEENKPASVRPWGDTPGEGFKTAGMNWSNREIRGQDFTRVAAAQRYQEGVKVAMKDDETGNKMGGDGFSDPTSTCRRHGSKSKARKAASAMIAKIPYPLAAHIAKSFKPRERELKG